MKMGAWPRDTIASRFALTVVLAVVSALALVRLFYAVGGVWAQEPLAHSLLPARARNLVRVIEAAPPEVRPALATAAARDGLAVEWYDATSSVSAMLWLDSGPAKKEWLRRHLLGVLGRAAVIFEPDSPLRLPQPLAHEQPQRASAYF